MAIYYTAPGGVDATGGTHGQIGNPFATVQFGWDQLSAGDTLLVRAGTYDEGIGTGVASGSGWGAGQLVRVANYPGETVWLAPSATSSTASSQGYCIWVDANISYTEFDGINTDGTADLNVNIVISTNNSNNPHHFRITNSEHIGGAVGGSGCIVLGGHTTIGATGSNQVVNCVIHGGGYAPPLDYTHASGGVYCAGPNNIVDGCEIYDTSGWAIQLYNAGADPADGNIIRNNYFHDITRLGDPNQCWFIICYGAHDNQMFNNVMWNLTVGGATGNGIQIYAGDNNKVWHNTIVDVPRYCYYIESGTGNEVRNNIGYGGGVANWLDSGTSTTADHNFFTGDPLFVNYASGNFHLQAGSPAIGAGVFIAAISVDIDGVPYTSPRSIGSYEFSSAIIGDAQRFGDNTIDDVPGVEDTRIRSDAATTNFGATGIITVENYEPSIIGHTLFRITGLSTLSPTRTLTNFSLHWYVEVSNGTDTTLRFRRCRRHWTQSGATYNTYDGVNGWTTPGALDTTTDIDSTVLASVVVPDAVGWITISDPALTAHIQDVISGFAANDGLMVDRSDGADDHAFRVFTSSEGADGFRPYATLTLDAEAGLGASATYYYTMAGAGG